MLFLIRSTLLICVLLGSQQVFSIISKDSRSHYVSEHESSQSDLETSTESSSSESSLSFDNGETSNILTQQESNNNQQTYHFLLKPKQISELYLDTVTNQTIRGHIGVMWKDKELLLLPKIAKGEYLKLKIYQNKTRILISKFHRKISFNFDAKSNCLYKIKISNHRSVKTKLISLHLSQFIEEFSTPGHEEHEQIRHLGIIGKIADQIHNYLSETKMLVNRVQRIYLADRMLEERVKQGAYMYFFDFISFRFEDYEMLQIAFVFLTVLTQICMIHRVLTPQSII